MPEQDLPSPAEGAAAPSANLSRAARVAVWLALAVFLVALAVAAGGAVVSG